MILLKKRAHLLLEIPLAMVRFLLLDVRDQRARVRRADGERPVPALPRKGLEALTLQPFGRRRFHFLNELRETLRRVQTNGEMHMVRHTADAKAIAFFIADKSREVHMQIGSHALVQQGKTSLRAEDNMDQDEAQRLGHGRDYMPGFRPFNSISPGTWGFAPRWYKAAPLALSVMFSFSLALSLCIGCKSATSATSPKLAAQATVYPPRPTLAPPAFRIFHQANGTFTLVTKDTATDDQISALIWQLRDAAHTHTFDKLKIPQKAVDAGAPTVWFHIYRGPKCASEKYADGAPPCGASYHAAGDYTYGGGAANPQWDKGVLHHGEDSETPLWNPETPYVAPPPVS
jgi:hypothetical protein